MQIQSAFSFLNFPPFTISFEDPPPPPCLVSLDMNDLCHLCLIQWSALSPHSKVVVVSSDCVVSLQLLQVPSYSPKTGMWGKVGILSASANGCLSFLYVALRYTIRLVQGVTLLSPSDSWDRLQWTSWTLSAEEAGIESWWMDGWIPQQLQQTFTALKLCMFSRTLSLFPPTGPQRDGNSPAVALIWTHMELRVPLRHVGNDTTLLTGKAFFFLSFFCSTSWSRSPPTRNFQIECGEVPPAHWRVVRSHSGKCGRLPVKVDEAGRGNNKEPQYSHHNKFIVVLGSFFLRGVTDSLQRGFAGILGLCELVGCGLYSRELFFKKWLKQEATEISNIFS